MSVPSTLEPREGFEDLLQKQFTSPSARARTRRRYTRAEKRRKVEHDRYLRRLVPAHILPVSPVIDNMPMRRRRVRRNLRGAAALRFIKRHGYNRPWRRRYGARSARFRRYRGRMSARLRASASGASSINSRRRRGRRRVARPIPMGLPHRLLRRFRVVDEIRWDKNQTAGNGTLPGNTLQFEAMAIDPRNPLDCYDITGLSGTWSSARIRTKALGAHQVNGWPQVVNQFDEYYVVGCKVTVTVTQDAGPIEFWGVKLASQQWLSERTTRNSAYLMERGLFPYRRKTRGGSTDSEPGHLQRMMCTYNARTYHRKVRGFDHRQLWSAVADEPNITAGTGNSAQYGTGANQIERPFIFVWICPQNANSGGATSYAHIEIDYTVALRSKKVHADTTVTLE